MSWIGAIDNRLVEGGADSSDQDATAEVSTYADDSPKRSSSSRQGADKAHGANHSIDSIAV